MDLEMLVIAFIFLNVFAGFGFLFYKLTREDKKLHGKK